MRKSSISQIKDEWTVTVCDACLRACCWQGVFYCDDYRTAGTKDITIAEAKTKGLEHADYWLDDERVKSELQNGGKQP